MAFDLRHGDCLYALRAMSDCSVDAIVTDPPYGLSFMGKAWDYDVPTVEIWAECLRVLKPGGHLLAFAGTRTQHRMAVRIEDAGFEIRDLIAWVYGSGFPKSHNVSKGIDKAAGAVRETVAVQNNFGATKLSQGKMAFGDYAGSWDITAPATDAARQWDGWGTALKPALEPITLARKPLIGTVAANVLEHGTGAINIDACRVGSEGGTRKNSPEKRKTINAYGSGLNGGASAQIDAGRWPANLIHDGSAEVGDLMGEPSRFFYCAKASKRDRDEGLTSEPIPFVQFPTANGTSDKASSLSEGRATAYKNNHPTVKPTELMRYLCRLVTQPGGLVLDPFMGSGSTGKAAMLEGFRFIGIERDAHYIEIAQARIEAAVRLL